MTPNEARNVQGSPMANAAQAAAWNGPEAASWAEAHRTGEIHDALIQPLLDAAAIGPGDRVLDLGCGTGEMTRLAARRAVRGEAVGMDLSALMVSDAVAAATAEGVTNVRFEVGDVQVHPFPPEAFDLAISHFGIMFFEDPTAAFANVAGALRSGGRLLFVCPQAMERCDWYLVPLAALMGRWPARHDAPSQMFSLADPHDVEDILGRAGFVDVQLAPMTAALRFGPDVATATRFFAGSGPVRALIERRPDLGAAKATEILNAALEPFLFEDGVRIAGAHWLVTAHRPATHPRPTQPSADRGRIM